MSGYGDPMDNSSTSFAEQEIETILQEMDTLCYTTRSSLDTDNFLLYFQLPLTILGVTANLVSLVTLNMSHSSPTSFLLKALICADIFLLVIYLPGRYYKLDPSNNSSVYIAMVIFPELYGIISIKYWIGVSLALMTFVNMCRPLKSPDWNTYKKAYGLVAISLIAAALFNSIGFSQMKMITTYDKKVSLSVMTAKHAFYAYDNVLHTLFLYPGTCIALLIFVGPVLSEVKHAKNYTQNTGNMPTLQAATVATLFVLTTTHVMLTVAKVLQLIFYVAGSCLNVVQTAEFCNVVLIIQSCLNFTILYWCSEAFRRKLCFCCNTYDRNKDPARYNDEEEELVQI